MPNDNRALHHKKKNNTQELCGDSKWCQSGHTETDSTNSCNIKGKRWWKQIGQPQCLPLDSPEATWGLENSMSQTIGYSSPEKLRLNQMSACCFCVNASSHMYSVPQQWLQYLGTIVMKWMVRPWLISRSCLVVTTWGMNCPAQL